jgi:hypothetical protein
MMRPMYSSENLRRFGPLEWLIVALSAASLVVFAFQWARMLGFLWDISVYERAVADYSRGVDPYRTDVMFPFVYHPFVLRLFAILSSVLPLKVVLPALTLAALVWLSRELLDAAAWLGTAPLQSACETRKRSIGPWQLALAIAAASGFGGNGAAGLLSGNMSLLMHFALMAALLRGGRVHSVFWRHLPYVLILVFALIKPYFLIFLAAPVLLYERRMVAVGWSLAVAALFTAMWLSFQVYWAAEYAHFIANLRYHILGRGDLGYTFFYVFGAITRKPLLALELHTIVSLLLIALVPLLFAKKYGRAIPFAPQLLVLYLTLTLANPRMKDYDLFPALIGFFAVSGMLSKWSTQITLAGLLLSLVPLLSPAFPDLSSRHPMLFDPFGTWQIVALAAIGLVFLVNMFDEGAQIPPRDTDSTNITSRRISA